MNQIIDQWHLLVEAATVPYPCRRLLENRWPRDLNRDGFGPVSSFLSSEFRLPRNGVGPAGHRFFPPEQCAASKKRPCFIIQRGRLDVVNSASTVSGQRVTERDGQLTKHFLKTY